MDENVKMILDEAEDLMKKSLVHLESELNKIRAGKANPVMLDGLRAEYYGAPTPLNQLASISAQDARMLVIQPFDKKSIAAIERSIKEANLGFNPQNDGIVIRIPVPIASEERRRQLVKQARDEGENAKIAMRNVRRDHNDMIKKLKDEKVSEDEIKTGEAKMQDITNAYIAKVEEVLKKKEAEIMTI
ncbi:MAG TPA: ribosome recycling factor [Bacteroidia bacterium]|nr:ribosome recycling factor [Bacteroidia bacterium]